LKPSPDPLPRRRRPRFGVAALVVASNAAASFSAAMLANFLADWSDLSADEVLATVVLGSCLLIHFAAMLVLLGSRPCEKGGGA